MKSANENPPSALHRRQFLKCAAWAGTGLMWTLKGGVPSSLEIIGSAAAADNATNGLSPREQEVLDLLARGYLYKEIAERLNISVPTVNTYVRRIYEKILARVQDRAMAKGRLNATIVHWAIEVGRSYRRCARRTCSTYVRIARA